MSLGVPSPRKNRTAARDHTRRLRQIAGDAERPRHVHDAAEGHDAEDDVGAGQGLGNLADGAIPAGRNDQVAPLGHGLPGQLGGVARALGRPRGEGDTGVAQGILRLLGAASIRRHAELLA